MMRYPSDDPYYDRPTPSTVPADLYPAQPRYDHAGYALPESLIRWRGMLAEMAREEQDEAWRHVRALANGRPDPAEFSRRFDQFVNDLSM